MGIKTLVDEQYIQMGFYHIVVYRGIKTAVIVTGTLTVFYHIVVYRGIKTIRSDKG